jgi:hypothetical protein
MALIALDDGTWMALWFSQLNFRDAGGGVRRAVRAGCNGRPRTGAAAGAATWAASPAPIIVLAATAPGAGALGALSRARPAGALDRRRRRTPICG